jgi:hypothetical protein
MKILQDTRNNIRLFRLKRMMIKCYNLEMKQDKLTDKMNELGDIIEAWETENVILDFINGK